MLYPMVDRVIETIERLDIERDAVAFAEQVLLHNPAPFREIPSPVSLALVGDRAEPEGAEQDGAHRLGALLLARALLGLIKEIPDHARQLRQLAASGRTTPHVRAALLGALAYLVQPAELVDDRSPGGYGFVDDAIVLTTMRLAMARMGVPLSLDEGRETRALSLLGLALSPTDFAKMQNLITRTWNEIHLLLMLSPNIAAAQAQHIEHCPLDLRYDWSTPAPSFTRGTPTLCPGSFGEVCSEGITIDFAGGGMIHMTPTGDICGYD